MVAGIAYGVIVEILADIQKARGLCLSQPEPALVLGFRVIFPGVSMEVHENAGPGVFGGRVGKDEFQKAGLSRFRLKGQDANVGCVSLVAHA